MTRFACLLQLFEFNQYLGLLFLVFYSCLMDSDNLIVTDGLEAAHQNGLNKQFIVSEEENFLPDNVNRNIEKAMADDTDLQNGNLESICTGELKEGSNECGQSNGLTVSTVGSVICILFDCFFRFLFV